MGLRKITIEVATEGDATKYVLRSLQDSVGAESETICETAEDVLTEVASLLGVETDEETAQLKLQVLYLEQELAAMTATTTAAVATTTATTTEETAQPDANPLTTAGPNCSGPEVPGGTLPA